MKKTLIAFMLTATLWAAGTVALEGRQGFNAQIQAALNALGYVTSSNTVVQWSKSFLMAASSYINFGSTSGVNGYGLRDSAGTMQYKNSGGSWVAMPTGGQAPAAAKYLLQQANASLPNAQDMSALVSGFVINTTTTGVQSVWAGGGCSNSFISNIAANGVLTCNSQPGTAGVADWGASGFSWRNIFFSGASGTPGTNDFEITGTSTGGHRVITFPDASITVQSTTGTPAGFIIASQAIGDLLQAASTTTWGRLADVATGSVLCSGGVGTVFAWCTAPTVTTLVASTSLTAGSALNLQTTSTDGVIVTNTTAALVGTPSQISPRVRWSGNGWDTDDATSRPVGFFAEAIPTGTTTVGGQWKLGFIDPIASTLSYPFSVTSLGTSSGVRMSLDRPVNTQYATLKFLTAGADTWDIYNSNSATPDFIIYSYGSSSAAMTITYVTGSVAIPTLTGTNATFSSLSSASGVNYVCSNTIGLLSKNNTACVGTDAAAIALVPQLLERIESLERRLGVERR